MEEEPAACSLGSENARQVRQAEIAAVLLTGSGMEFLGPRTRQL